jgi:hypothetical protein
MTYCTCIHLTTVPVLVLPLVITKRSWLRTFATIMSKHHGYLHEFSSHKVEAEESHFCCSCLHQLVMCFAPQRTQDLGLKTKSCTAFYLLLLFLPPIRYWLRMALLARSLGTKSPTLTLPLMGSTKSQSTFDSSRRLCWDQITCWSSAA